MKTKSIIFFILNFFISSSLFSIDIYNYDFFGFKLKSTTKEIIEKLINEKKKYRIDKSSFGVEYTIIQPNNQSVEDGENLDYLISIYKDKIFKIFKFNLKKEYIDKIKKDFGKEPTIIEQNEDLIVSDLKIDNIIIRIKNKEKINNYSLEIINGLVSEEINNDMKKLPENSSKSIKIYTPKIDNLRFRETPTLDGKFIRMLVKGEKLEFMEKGKEETVSGVKGTWVKVKTEKGEVGWAFDAYLEEVK